MDGSAEQVIGYSTYTLIVTTVIFGLTLVVLVNGAKQVLFRKRNEPPVVFHWLPFVGSAISYGQEPMRFLNDCQAKVQNGHSAFTIGRLSHLLTTLTLISTAIFSHLFFSAEGLRYTWGSRGTTSS